MPDDMEWLLPIEPGANDPCGGVVFGPRPNEVSFCDQPATYLLRHAEHGDTAVCAYHANQAVEHGAKQPED